MINEHRWLDRANLPKQRKRKRRCKHCKTVLSIYNLNDYCHAHRAQGIKDTMKEMEAIAYKKYQAQKRYHEKKRKRKAAELLNGN